MASSVQSGVGTPPNDGGSVFATTHWSVVAAAGSTSAAAAAKALELLCQTYWQPLYAFARRSGRTPADAQDLVQGFFAEFLESQALAHADQKRGRFRSFLLASFKHFAAHEREKQQALKRGGRQHMLALPFDTAETGLEMADTCSPDRAYDRQWALTLLDSAFRQLRSEYQRTGRLELFEGLKETLSGERSELPYDDLARGLAMNPGAVKTAASRLRARYRLVLREQIAQTVTTTAEIEEELRSLFQALNT